MPTITYVFDPNKYEYNINITYYSPAVTELYDVEISPILQTRSLVYSSAFCLDLKHGSL